jgi:hypothetical protein
MRKLLLVALIAVIGVLPVAGFAQTPAAPPTHPAPPASAPAPAAAAPSLRPDDTTRVLTIGLGAVTGMVLFSVVSTNMISGQALASLGQGVVVFTGTVIGGLLGNWLYAREKI